MKLFAFLLTWSASLPLWAYGIVVSPEMELSGYTSITVEEFNDSTCRPVHPVEIRYLPNELVLLFELGIGFQACDFVFTDWTYSANKLYLPVESGLSEGDLTISYVTRLGRTGSAQTSLSLAQPKDQLVFLFNDEVGTQVFWRSDFMLERTISVPDLGETLDLTFLGLRAGGRGRYYVEIDAYSSFFDFTFNVGLRVDPVLLAITEAIAHIDRFDGFADTVVTKNSYFSTVLFPSVLFRNYNSIDLNIDVEAPVHSLATSEPYQVVLGSMADVNKLAVISDVTQLVVGEVLVGTQPTEIESSFDDEWLAVWNSGDQSISTVDVSTLSVAATTTMPEPINHFSPGTSNDVFYTWADSGNIYRLEYPTGTITSQVNLGPGLKGISSNPEVDEVLAFFDNGQNTTIRILDGSTLTVLQTQQIPGRVRFVPQYLSGSYYRPRASFTFPVPSMSRFGLVSLGLLMLLAGILAQRSTRTIRPD